MQIHTCEKGCCNIKVQEYTSHPFKLPKRRNCKKAGVFLYDPLEQRVLMVQSRGKLWGPPKGSLEIQRGETYSQCAIRELKEETGLDIVSKDFQRAIKIKNKAFYYYSERKACDVFVQQHDNYECADVNAISWIRLECLDQCIRDGFFVVNHHCKIAFKRFLGHTFPHNTFVEVGKKKRRQNHRKCKM